MNCECIFEHLIMSTMDYTKYFKKCVILEQSNGQNCRTRLSGNDREGSWPAVQQHVLWLRKKSVMRRGTQRGRLDANSVEAADKRLRPLLGGNGWTEKRTDESK